jgi:hypothetical protein
MLNYDPDAGVFTWKVSRGNRVAGSVAGTIDNNGYCRIKFGSKLELAHRLAWLWAHGKWPQNQIDHINGNRSDNRIHNLRDVSRALNGMNRHRPNPNNRVGLIGVDRQRNGKFRATFCRKHLGIFATASEAEVAVTNARASALAD